MYVHVHINTEEDPVTSPYAPADTPDPAAQHQADHRFLIVTLAAVGPTAAQLVDDFYRELFTAHPDVRPMFPPDMTAQRDKLLKAVIALATHYDRPDQLMPALTAMGRRHAGYGVTIYQFAAVGAVLLDVLARHAAAVWTPAHEAAWTRAYDFAAGAMLMAAAETAEVRPAA